MNLVTKLVSRGDLIINKSLNLKKIYDSSAHHTDCDTIENMQGKKKTEKDHCSTYCIAEHFRQEFIFVAFVKAIF